MNAEKKLRWVVKDAVELRRLKEEIRRYDGLPVVAGAADFYGEFEIVCKTLGLVATGSYTLVGSWGGANEDYDFVEMSDIVWHEVEPETTEPVE